MEQVKGGSIRLHRRGSPNAAVTSDRHRRAATRRSSGHTRRIPLSMRLHFTVLLSLLLFTAACSSNDGDEVLLPATARLGNRPEYGRCRYVVWQADGCTSVRRAGRHRGRGRSSAECVRCGLESAPDTRRPVRQSGAGHAADAGQSASRTRSATEYARVRGRRWQHARGLQHDRLPRTKARRRLSFDASRHRRRPRDVRRNRSRDRRQHRDALGCRHRPGRRHRCRRQPGRRGDDLCALTQRHRKATMRSPSSPSWTIRPTLGRSAWTCRRLG